MDILKNIPLLFLPIMFVIVNDVDATEKFTSYLFTFFAGNDSSKGQESIFFAFSDDAHNFKSLNNGKPILNSKKISLEGGVRDPHILRGENNDFYIVATDMVSAKGWASNSGIVMLRSKNLADWKSSTVDFPTTFSNYKSADRVWAPQTIYDPSVGKYMVYFAMRLGPSDKDKIYYAYTDSAFTKLETEPKLLFKYGNNSAIDADIIFKDSTYHLFFKTEQSGNGIKSALSKKLTEGYVLYDKYLQLTSEQVEGSCVFKLIDSDTWVLMYDVYNSGRYEFAISTDLKTFAKDPKPISFDFTPRHGTIIPITNAEKNALLAKWNPTEIVTDCKKYQHPVLYRFCENIFDLEFKRSINDLIVSIVDLSGKELQRWTTSGKTIKICPPTLSPGIYHVYYRTNTEDIGCTRIIVK